MLLLDTPDRSEDYSASARHATALPALLGLAPATVAAGMGASLGALAMLHAHVRNPGTFAGLYLQSGSYFRLRWDPGEAGFARFGRISRFVGRVLRAPAEGLPVPITADLRDRRRTSPTTARWRPPSPGRATTCASWSTATRTT